MQMGTAKILLADRQARRLVASAGRISTTEGSALEIFEAAQGDERDFRLIRKVLSSGHHSILEHQPLGIAFDGVSVLCEQFMIESRLAAFTVKSRRYVDFSHAGFVLPETAAEGFSRRMEELFALYTQLVEMGIPREDARFVLPYCFRSNFYMSLNAREMVKVIGSMLWGRGCVFPEIRALGQQLAEQFDALYPGVLEAERPRHKNDLPEILPDFLEEGKPARGGARLLGAPDGELLRAATAFSGRTKDLSELLVDARPRELELVNAVFLVENASLSCVTHFARHRIQSPLWWNASKALARGNYVLPESIAKNEEAAVAYKDAFRRQADFVREQRSGGMCLEDTAYLALSGHTSDILFSMNGRELLHFFKLRTCNRAQWEIRGIAREMLRLLAEREPEIFRGFGPSCLVEGKCPEGKLSCGHPVTKELW